VDLILCTAGLPAHPGQARLSIARTDATQLHARRRESHFLAQQRLAPAEAQKEGWSEVVLLNERGEVAECTTAISLP